MDPAGAEVADLILGQAQSDAVVLQARDRVLGNDDLPPAPQVAALEYELRRALVPHQEPFDVADVMAVGGDDGTRPAELDLATRDVVVGDHHMRVGIGDTEAAK